METVTIIGMALDLVSWLEQNIPNWISRAKTSGELTPEQEAAFQKRMEDIFNQPYAQP